VSTNCTFREKWIGLKVLFYLTDTYWLTRHPNKLWQYNSRGKVRLPTQPGWDIKIGGITCDPHLAAEETNSLNYQQLIELSS
jgi:hypothetical protein